MKLSPSGEEFLKGYEVLMLTPYLDQAGHWTVAWGHKMTKAEPKSETISLDRAKALFADDIKPCEIIVNHEAKAPFTQAQFDAMVILTYNIGLEAFHTSHVLKLWNLQSPIRAIEPWWKAWNKVTIDGKLQVSNGLINRRAAEWRIFTLGDYVR